MKKLFYDFENLKSCNSLNKTNMWYVGLDVFQVFIVILIGSRMSEIVAAYVHSRSNGGRT